MHLYKLHTSNAIVNGQSYFLLELPCFFLLNHIQVCPLLEIHRFVFALPYCAILVMNNLQFIEEIRRHRLE